MKINLQLFGGGGGSSGIHRYNLPQNPKKSSKFNDVTHPKKKENTNYRNYRDEKKRIEVEYHPKKNGANGWQGKDHYHVKNPNSTGDHDFYLDKNGNPCSKGSQSSHLPPGDYDLLLRSLK